MEKDYEKRLIDIANFMRIICIEGGCGYDLKIVIEKLIYGKINYKEAIDEWHQLGWKTFG